MLLISMYPMISISSHIVRRSNRKSNYKGVAITLYSPDEEVILLLLKTEVII